MCKDCKEKKEKGYDLDELKRLRGMSYEDLAVAPGQPEARLREARFALQVKVAQETSKLSTSMTGATKQMAKATIVLALATALLAILEFLKVLVPRWG